MTAVFQQISWKQIIAWTGGTILIIISEELLSYAIERELPTLLPFNFAQSLFSQFKLRLHVR
jgi:hypothetical protein